MAVSLVMAEAEERARRAASCTAPGTFGSQLATGFQRKDKDGINGLVHSFHEMSQVHRPIFFIE
jgi:hypothetical protein